MDILNNLSRSNNITIALPESKYFTPNAFSKAYTNIFAEMFDMDSYVSQICKYENEHVSEISDEVTFNSNIFFIVLSVLDGTIQILPSDTVSNEVIKFKKQLIDVIDDKSIFKTNNMKWQSKRIKKVKDDISVCNLIKSQDVLLVISHYIKKAVSIVDENWCLLYESNWEVYDEGFVLIEKEGVYIIFEDLNHVNMFDTDFKERLLKK